jgi:hypothetical protein
MDWSTIIAFIIGWMLGRAYLKRNKKTFIERVLKKVAYTPESCKPYCVNCKEMRPINDAPGIFVFPFCTGRQIWHVRKKCNRCGKYDVIHNSGGITMLGANDTRVLSISVTE